VASQPADRLREQETDTPAPQAGAKIAPPRRVLVKEVNWLGDLVMSLPALRAIRRMCPGSRLSILIKHDLATFFDGARWIDEVIQYSDKPGIPGLAGTARIISRIRSGRFDLAILFPNSFSSALWMTLAGVPKRAGYARNARGPLLTHKTSPAPDALSGHQSRYWLAMIRDTLGIEDTADQCPIEVDSLHRVRMSKWLAARRARPDRALIALAPGSAYGPAKEWPAKCYSALIDLLDSRFETECVLVGAPGERAKCGEVARGSNRGAIVAAGETEVGDLLALLALCDGFAGNDSGSMHASAALGIPTVGIFGSTDPARTGPIGPATTVIHRAIECSPCLARTCRFGHYNCLSSIAPEEVASALEALGAFSSQRRRG
jgi:heptosyltransferase-2